MAKTITNQASVTYIYSGVTGSAESNIASATIKAPLSASKRAMNPEYRNVSEMVFIFTLTNNSENNITGIVISDDLAAYTLPGPIEIVPLTYIDSSYLYINGIFSSEITPSQSGTALQYNLDMLAPQMTAMIIYKTAVNEYAPYAVGDEITNVVTITAEELSEPVQTSYTMMAEEFADIRVMKSMLPNPVSEGSQLVYTFTVYNYGNTDATSLTLSDVFDPAPNIISIAVDQSPVSAADYSYQENTLSLPAAGSELALSVPAATFVQSPETGIISVTPGTVIITVVGII